jgi:predicted NBD/HSP70 family sugar kinase
MDFAISSIKCIPPMASAHTIPPEDLKRNTLLQTIYRQGKSSRSQLAKTLQISNSRVCSLIDRMVGESLLVEQNVNGDRRGRRGLGLELNPEYGHLIGLDMEAKRLRVVVTNFAGEVVYQTRKNLGPVKSKQALLDEIIEFLDTAIEDARPKYKRLLGIGLAASGVIDFRAGTILHYDMIPQAVDLPLRSTIGNHLRLPCIMENNIRAMTLAEWTMGAARGLSSFICLAIRSGVGAGIVLDGRLLRGSHGMSGEVGYMVLPIAGNAAKWRNLQQTVSESALAIDAESEQPVLDERAARQAGEIIGSQLASIACILDPQAIVLAGGLLKPDGPVWLHAVGTFRQSALPELVQSVRLLPAALGPFAAAMGAANQCLYELFPASTRVG